MAGTPVDAETIIQRLNKQKEWHEKTAITGVRVIGCEGYTQTWATRIRLELVNNIRDLALFNLAIDSKLRGCDLVTLKIRDICHGKTIQSRATIIQKKTGLPVQFELTENTRNSVQALLTTFHLNQNDYLFKSRIHTSEHLSTRQYGRIVDSWFSMIRLDWLRSNPIRHSHDEKN